MPISNEEKLIFVHIPKTGGTSINSMLGFPGDNKPELLFGTPTALQHLTLDQIKTKIPKEQYTNYKKFTIVRNPYDRAVSEFCWLKKHNTINQEVTFKVFCKNLDSLCSPKHSIPQHCFVNNDIDFILRFEDINSEIKKVLPNKTLPHKQRSRSNSDYKKFYCDETKRIIYDKYKKDFEVFNYESKL